VVSDDLHNIVAQLRRLHIPVLVEPAEANLGGVYAQIEQLAQATGHAAGATQVVARIRHQVKAIVGSTP
jgi:iron complex transport system substrate-binding protein